MPYTLIAFAVPYHSVVFCLYQSSPLLFLHDAWLHAFCSASHPLVQLGIYEKLL